VQDPGWLRTFVGRLTDSHEASRQAPWHVGDAPPPYIEKMLSQIVGFEFSIVSLTGKWKVSQNHPAANRRGVAAGLAGGDSDAREIGEFLSSWEAARNDEPTR
jgi:transcriptional regulator